MKFQKGKKNSNFLNQKPKSWENDLFQQFSSFFHIWVLLVLSNRLGDLIGRIFESIL